MSLVGDLKSASERQFTAALRILDVAAGLNRLRRDLEAAGDPEAANRVRSAIERLTQEAEDLTAEARQSGRAVVDALRSAW